MHGSETAATNRSRRRDPMESSFGRRASPQQGPGCERRGKFGGERGIRTPDTLAGTPDFESVAFSRSASSPESVDPVTQRWRRGWDSNPRYVSVYTLSKRAPSAARPPLPFQTCFLRWRKNSRKISPQSCARTPLTTCTRWFKRPSRTRSNRVSTAPALGSATHHASIGDHHRADGHFAFFRSEARLRERLRHEGFVHDCQRAGRGV